jgi:hypothetical protein
LLDLDDVLLRFYQLKVGVAAVTDAAARSAGATWDARTFIAQQSLSEGGGDRRLAYLARPEEHVGVAGASCPHSLRQQVERPLMSHNRPMAHRPFQSGCRLAGVTSAGARLTIHATIVT